MARQRKKRRTQAAGSAQNERAQGLASNKTSNITNPEHRIPKSMVLRMGGSRIGPSVSQLALDVRTVMEPHTASRLKERRTNKLRDFTTMARPLDVSHMLAFYRSEKSGNVNLNIIVSPRGPTFAFRVEKYSLAKDVVKTQKRPKTGGLGGSEGTAPPLLVMNNFKTAATSTQKPDNAQKRDAESDSSRKPVPKHLEDLSVSIFQSMFPPVQPQKTPLDRIKRVLLLNRLPTSEQTEGTYTLQFRHYAISAKKVMHLTRGVKRLRAAEKFSKQPSRAQRDPTLLNPEDVHNTMPSLNGDANGLPKRKKDFSLPDLSKLDDVADYILDPSAAGYTSASETELDTDAEVEVLQSATRKVLNKKARQRLSTPRQSQNADEQGEDDGDAKQRPQADSKVEKRAVKLSELGPRMTLRLIKVQEGVAEGRVLWHEYINKSATEEKELDKAHEKRRAEKEERRRVQKENVERKQAAKAALKGQKQGEPDEGEEDDENEDREDDDIDYDDMDEDDWDDIVDDGLGEEEHEEDEDEDEMEE